MQGDVPGVRAAAAPPAERPRVLIASEILKEIRAAGFLVDVGLDYLTLDRRAGTLSGGEAQRIRLATQIGSGLMGVLYILDEPSIGLHQRDNARLLARCSACAISATPCSSSSTTRRPCASADWIVDFGPGAGEHGGEVVAEGPLRQIEAHRRRR